MEMKKMSENFETLTLEKFNKMLKEADLNVTKEQLVALSKEVSAKRAARGGQGTMSKNNYQDDFINIIDGLYKWTDNKEIHQDLPNFVRERITAVVDIGEDEPISLMGEMRAVLAYEDDDEVADILPAPTKNFIEWRNRYPMMRELQIAAELIYGTRSPENEVEAND